MTRVLLWAAIAALLLGGIVGIATESGGSSGPEAAGVHPPKPGEYRYTGTLPFTMRVRSDGSGGGVVHQVISIPAANGVELRNHLAWSSRAARTERTELQLGPGAAAAASCEWRPVTTEYVFPLRVGQTWATDSTCKASVLGQAITIRQVQQARVTGRGRVDVGGTAVDTWSIERTTTFAVSLPEQAGRDDKSVSTEEFAPTFGWFIRRHIEGNAQTGDVVLERLSPS